MPRPSTNKNRSPARAAEDASSGATSQSLERGLYLLEQVVERPLAGSSLNELAAATGLSRPTAHRLLLSLRKLGFVEYDAQARRFFPGLKAYRMGLASAARFDIVELADRGMSRLADETGDTVFLSLRDGDSALCAARKIGAFPIRTLTLNVGDFRPLGVGAGSLALLAALPDEEIRHVLARNRARLASYPRIGSGNLKEMVARTRRQGYSVNDGLILEEMAAVAVPVRDGSGRAIAAISVAAIRSRMAPSRRGTIVKLLERERAAIESMLGPAPKTAKGAR
jgi:DNA-binding IclR family transcriptional regulator